MEDSRQQVSIAFRWLPMLLVGAVLAGSLAFIVVSSQPNEYQATSKLVVQVGPNPEIADIQVANELAARYAEWAASRDMLASVAATAGFDDGSVGLSDSFQIDHEPGTAIVSILAQDGTPDGARILAEAMGTELVSIATSQVNPDLLREADAYVALVRAEIAELQSQIEALQALPVPPDGELTALRDRLVARQVILVDTIPRSSENRRYQLEYIETPATTASPVSPQPLYVAALAAMVGLLLAAAIAFILEYLSDRMRDGRQVAKATGAPLVGTVTEKRGDARMGPAHRVTALMHAKSAEAEAYRRVRGMIDPATWAGADSHGRGLLITGPAPSDSIAVVAANIAVAYAQSGARTILVDADIEAPLIHTLFGINEEPGLMTMLAYPARTFPPMPSGHPMLRVVPSGAGSVYPPGFVAAIPLAELLARIGSEADIMVVKGPSLPGGPDAPVLSKAIGATLLVVSQGSSGKLAREASRSLEVAGTRPSGVVLVREVRGSHGRAATSTSDRADPGTAGHRNAES